MVALSIIAQHQNFLLTQSLITFLVKRDNLRHHYEDIPQFWRFDRRLKSLGRLSECFMQ